MELTHSRSVRYAGRGIDSHFTPSYRITPPTLPTFLTPYSSEDKPVDEDKVIEGSDPKTDHASALELDGEFYLNSLVTDDTMGKMAQAMFRVARLKDKKKRKQQTITLNINTRGGSVDAGFMLGNTIERIKRETGVRVNTRVIGEASSMGCVLLQFGDVRQADFLSNLMIHDIQASTGYGDTHDHILRGKVLTLMRNQLASVFAARNTAGHNDVDWWLENYLQRESYLSPQEALELGVIDEITGGLPHPRN